MKKSLAIIFIIIAVIICSITPPIKAENEPTSEIVENAENTVNGENTVESLQAQHQEVETQIEKD